MKFSLSLAALVVLVATTSALPAFESKLGEFCEGKAFPLLNP
jgi:hypothetical protein